MSCIKLKVKDQSTHLEDWKGHDDMIVQLGCTHVLLRVWHELVHKCGDM